MSMTPTPVPAGYRAGMAAGLGVVLFAGLVLGLADVVHTGGAAALPVLGLWSLIALPIALGSGLVLGAGNATWGDGWVLGAFRRLRDDRALDRQIAGGLLAAVIVGAVFVIGLGKISLLLVGEVQRKNVGALLVGVVALVLLPILAIAALPIYRVTRRVGVAIPAFGPVSRVAALLVGAAVATLAAGLFVVFRKLDYQALNLTSLFMMALLPPLAVVLGVLLYGPLAGLRAKLPARGVLGACA